MIGSLHLLRFLEGQSVLHRAGARSKVLALTMLVFGLSFDPSWSSVGIVWGTIVVGFVVARLPRGVLPRPPRLLWWAMGLALVFGLLAGGEPSVELGESSLAIGGLIFQIRFFGVTLGILGVALLLGWTTRLADLPPAASWLLRPLGLLRVPTNDVVAALTLAVRSLPLMADELSTTAALWSSRPPTSDKRLVQAIDFAATATVAATRRATELGEAVGNRGPLVVNARQQRWVLADGLILAAAVGALCLMVLL